MKIAAGFLYVLWTVVYLSPAVPGNAYWYAADKVVQTAFVGVLAYFLEQAKGNSENERLFFTYLKWLSLANAVYIAICAYKNYTFALYNTPIFAYVMGIGFVAFMVHCALLKR
jgi:hypothetical protein